MDQKASAVGPADYPDLEGVQILARGEKARMQELCEKASLPSTSPLSASSDCAVSAEQSNDSS
jgi:hypothetical protein